MLELLPHCTLARVHVYRKLWLNLTTFSRDSAVAIPGAPETMHVPPPPSNGAEREREREKEGENRRETDTERAGMEWVGEEEGVGDTMEVVIGCCSGRGGGGVKCQ